MTDAPVETEWWRVRREDPRTVAELLDTLLWSLDEAAVNLALGVLQVQGSRDVFEAAAQLCESPCPRDRARGAEILGQLGHPEPAFLDESLEVLLRLLRPDEHVDVICSAAFALHHRRDPRAVEPLCRLKGHLFEDVRYAVVHGLLTHEDDLAVGTLIELSEDPDDHVRNWATFGLGAQVDRDTPGLREALLRRLDEEDHEIRGEALVGLARRKDERSYQPLLRELTGDWVSMLALEAAYEWGDERLHPTLQGIAIEDWDSFMVGALNSALESCAPKAPEAAAS